MRMALERKLGEESVLNLGPREIEPDLERTLLIASIDGEDAVGRDLGDGLGVVEIIAIFEALPFGDLRL